MLKIAYLRKVNPSKNSCNNMVIMKLNYSYATRKTVWNVSEQHLVVINLSEAGYVTQPHIQPASDKFIATSMCNYLWSCIGQVRYVPVHPTQYVHRCPKEYHQPVPNKPSWCSCSQISCCYSVYYSDIINLEIFILSLSIGSYMTHKPRSTWYGEVLTEKLFHVNVS